MNKRLILTTFVFVFLFALVVSAQQDHSNPFGPDGARPDILPPDAHDEIEEPPLAGSGPGDTLPWDNQGQTNNSDGLDLSRGGVTQFCPHAECQFGGSERGGQVIVGPGGEHADEDGLSIGFGDDGGDGGGSINFGVLINFGGVIKEVKDCGCNAPKGSKLIDVVGDSPGKFVFNKSRSTLYDARKLSKDHAVLGNAWVGGSCGKEKKKCGFLGLKCQTTCEAFKGINGTIKNVGTSAASLGGGLPIDLPDLPDLPKLF